MRVGRFSPASIRREIEGVCTRVHTLPRACVRAACTDADRPLCSIGAGGLAKMAVSEARRGEARRGEARRGEARRGWKTAKTARPANCTHTRARAHSPSRVLGPRQLTSDGRKSFYVFIHRSFLPDRYPPSTSPFVASLSRGWDRFEDYRVSCEPARICRSTYWSRFEEIVVRI